MSYNLAKIQEVFQHACDSQEVQLIVPISLNSRLSTTLGRVIYKRTYQGVQPLGIEFSKSFVESQSDETIYNVILHEAAHYIVMMKTNQPHGHDRAFKEVCALLGTTYDKSAIPQGAYVENQENIPKYKVYCPHCKEVIGTYQRMCKTIRHLPYCVCNMCKQGDLQLLERGKDY